MTARQYKGISRQLDDTLAKYARSASLSITFSCLLFQVERTSKAISTAYIGAAVQKYRISGIGALIWISFDKRPCPTFSTGQNPAHQQERASVTMQKQSPTGIIPMQRAVASACSSCLSRSPKETATPSVGAQGSKSNHSGSPDTGQALS